MSLVNTDIDIDFADRKAACNAIKHVAASVRTKTGQIQKHPSGVYLQNIPIHPFIDAAALEHDRAEKYGYFKIDFLSNSVYHGVRNKEHLKALMTAEIPWDFLADPAIVSQLTHIHSSFDVVNLIKPKSVEDLAVVLALMRPAKRHLLRKSREEIDREIWSKEADGYAFKKSHAIAYAMSIVVQLNLMIEGIVETLDGTNEDDGFQITY